MENSFFGFFGNSSVFACLLPTDSHYTYHYKLLFLPFSICAEKRHDFCTAILKQFFSKGELGLFKINEEKKSLNSDSRIVLISITQ